MAMDVVEVLELEYLRERKGKVVVLIG